jgi:site-specific DNA-adenine methylase
MMTDSKREELSQLNEFGEFVVSRGHLDRIQDYEPKVEHLNALMQSLKLLCDDYSTMQSQAHRAN